MQQKFIRSSSKRELKEIVQLKYKKENLYAMRGF